MLYIYVIPAFLVKYWTTKHSLKSLITFIKMKDSYQSLKVKIKFQFQIEVQTNEQLLCNVHTS